MGAIITAIISRQRNKQQPIGYQQEVINIFKKSKNVPSLRAMLTVSNPTTGKEEALIQVDSLSVARITVINKGNQDLAEFTYGVTLAPGTNAVDVKVEPPDRHHEMKVLTSLGLTEPKNEIDFLLKPFNRGDQYRTTLNLIYAKEPGEIRLGSPHSTRFVELSGNDSPLLLSVLHHANLVVFALTLFGALAALGFSRIFDDIKQLLTK